jgi:hypothetical protein
MHDSTDALTLGVKTMGFLDLTNHGIIGFITQKFYLLFPPWQFFPPLRDIYIIHICIHTHTRGLMELGERIVYVLRHHYGGRA